MDEVWITEMRFGNQQYSLLKWNCFMIIRGYSFCRNCSKIKHYNKEAQNISSLSNYFHERPSSAFLLPISPFPHFHLSQTRDNCISRNEPTFLQLIQYPLAYSLK